MDEKKGPSQLTGKDGIAVCQCWQSDNWPFCDGSHHTFATDKEPSFIQLDKEKTYEICRCYKTKNLPFCDGSHKSA